MLKWLCDSHCNDVHQKTYSSNSVLCTPISHRSFILYVFDQIQRLLPSAQQKQQSTGWRGRARTSACSPEEISHHSHPADSSLTVGSMLFDRIKSSCGLTPDDAPLKKKKPPSPSIENKNFRFKEKCCNDTELLGRKKDEKKKKLCCFALLQLGSERSKNIKLCWKFSPASVSWRKYACAS